MNSFVARMAIILLCSATVLCPCCGLAWVPFIDGANVRGATNKILFPERFLQPQRAVNKEVPIPRGGSSKEELHMAHMRAGSRMTLVL